jgi:hypothetical protein
MALKLNKRVTSMISPSHCLGGVACITGNLDKTMSDHTRADFNLDLNFNFYGRSEDRRGSSNLWLRQPIPTMSCGILAEEEFEHIV